MTEVFRWLEQMSSELIYEGKRLVQPYKVANFQRGDGIEKAFLLANVACNRGIGEALKIVVQRGKVIGEVPDRYSSNWFRWVCAGERGQRGLLEKIKCWQ